MDLVLVALEGPLAGQRLALPTGETLVGLGAAVDLTGDDAALPEHAAITVAETATVRAVGDSLTYLNGHRITAAPLLDGDVVQFGRSRFRVALTAAEAGRRCPACAAPLADEPLCPRCGRDVAALDAGLVPAAVAATEYCRGCGRPLPPDSRFCGACGRDSQAPPAAPGPRHVPGWAVALAVLAVLGMVLVVGSLGAVVGASLLRQRPVEAPLERPASVPAPVVTPAPSPPPAPAAGEAVRAPWLRRGRVRLRYGGQAGRTTRYDSTSQVAGTISVLGQAVPLNLEASSGYTQEVLAAADGRLRVRLTMHPFQVHQNGSAVTSGLPLTPPPVTFEMQTNGQVLHAESSPGAATEGVPGLPGALTTDAQAVLQQLAAASFPAQPVGIGDTWEQHPTVPLPGGGQVTLNAVSRLDGFELLDGLPVARIVTQLDAPLSMSLTAETAGGPVSNVGTLSGAVTTHFDPAAGELVRSQSDLALTMKMSAPGGQAEVLQGLPILGLTPDGGVTLEATGTVRQTIRRRP